MLNRVWTRGLLTLLLLPLALGACGQSAVRRAALQDDLPTLRREIAEAQKRGELDASAVQGLAKAVVERELSAAQGDVAVARVRDVRSCVRPVESSLDRLAQRRDAAGSAATLALLDAGLVSADDFVERYANDPDPDWRAVGARAAVGLAHREVRQRLMLDPDLRVRRAALQAAFRSPDVQDAPVLLEAARLDPDPFVRSMAVQTLGALGEKNLGGESVVRGLFDLWPRADSELRLVISDAWARAGSYGAGGEARLIWVVESEKGLPALVAARGLIHHRSSHVPAALATLLRAIETGSADEQRMAIRLAPLDDTQPRQEVFLTAIRKLTAGDDPALQVMAAARLTESPKDFAEAKAILRELAAEAPAEVQRQAQSALAVLGDRSIVKPLVAALQEGSTEERRHAALNLVRLEEYSAVAPSLGDEVAHVRTSVACAILTRAESGPPPS